MNGLKIAGITVLCGLVAIYVYREVEFRKPLTEAEIDNLASITQGQLGCSWLYELTGKGEWLRLRSIAERKLDPTYQDRYMRAVKKYEGFDPPEHCARLDKFPDLVQRWRD